MAETTTEVVKTETKVEDKTDYKAEYDKLKAQSGDVNARLDKFEKLEADRKAAADKKEQDDKIKAGDASKIIAEKDGALKAASDRLALFEKREKDRAAGIFKGLSADRQSALKDFEGKLDTTDWVALLEKEPGMAGGIPPAGGGGSVRGSGKEGEYEPTDKARQILKKLGRNTETLKSLEMVQDDEGHSKFRMQVGSFFTKMKKAGTQKLGLPGSTK